MCEAAAAADGKAIVLTGGGDRGKPRSAAGAQAASTEDTGEQVDQFGCTTHEAAELDAFRRVLLDGRVSPEEAVWQWCAGDAADIDPDRLRKMWDMFVDAAGRCVNAGHQATFLHIVTVLLDVCCPSMPPCRGPAGEQHWAMRFHTLPSCMLLCL